MRICMVAYAFYEMDNRVRRYAETLAAAGHEVDVLSLRSPGQPLRGEVNGVNVHRIQQRVVDERDRLQYFARVLAFLARSGAILTWRGLHRRYDLIHVHSVPDFEVFAAAFQKLRGTRVILDIHDLVPELYASKFKQDESAAFRALLQIERLCCRFADHVIAANHIWGERLTQRAVPPQKCSTYINYPDPKVFRARTSGRRGSDFVLMYPGTLAHRQGVDLAVKALPTVRKHIPNARMVFYGKGPQKEALLHLSDELGVRDHVEVHGPRPLEEIAARMAEADLAIEPKRAEGFGNEALSTKILEFMTVGVPVVASSTRVHAYYFDDQTVRFFEPGNADDLAQKVVEVARDEEARHLMVANGAQYAERYSWSRKSRDYLNLVERLCAGDRRGRQQCNADARIVRSV